MGGDGNVCVDTAQRQHILGGGGERSSSEPERKEGCVGTQNSRPPGHRVCLCMCQTKAVLPKRCLGVSFVPNPNALSRFVLAFVFMLFLCCFAADWSMEGASFLFFFFWPRFCCYPLSALWSWLLFCWLVLCVCFFWQGTCSCRALMSLVAQKMKAKNGCHVKVKWLLCIGWQPSFVAGPRCIQSK